MASSESESQLGGGNSNKRAKKSAPITGVDSFMSKFAVRDEFQPMKAFDMYAFNKANDEHVERYDLKELRPNGMVYADFVKIKQGKEKIEKNNIGATNFLSPGNVHVFIDPDNPL